MPFLVTVLVTMIKEKIMIIDDDQDIIEVISIFLKWKGFEVVAYTSPLNILEEVKAHRPSLIILDVQMGSFDGRDTCRQIKEVEELAHIPVIIFSADSNYGNNIKNYRCDDFIDKPFAISSLLSKVNFYTQQCNAAISLKAAAKTIA